MLDLEVNGYTKDAVISRLHARTGSREVRIRYDLLNRYDINLGELNVRNGSVSLNSLAEIKRTARFTLQESEANAVDWLNDKIRPVFCLRMPDGGYAEWPLGVFLLSSPVRRESNRQTVRDVEAYDGSLVLKEDKFTDRYRIPAGTKYTDAVTGILASAGIWKANIQASDGEIGSDKEFEIGTMKLQAINQLLTEINYTSLWADENGWFRAGPYVLPTNREAEYSYRNDDLSVIHPGASEELDLFSVPNKWVVVASNPEKDPLVSRYTNDLPTSMTSTVSRGRTIVDYRTVDDILDQATLDDFTRRIAYEASQVYGRFVFSTALMPHHSYSDMLFIEYSSLGVSSRFTEVSWSMDLNSGIMSHECRKVIHI